MKTTRTWVGDSAMMMIALSGVLSSCSQKVAPTATAPKVAKDSTAHIATVILHPVTIDTVATPLKARMSRVDAYWRSEVASKTAAIYQQRGYQSIWFDDHGPSPLYEAAK